MFGSGWNNPTTPAGWRSGEDDDNVFSVFQCNNLNSWTGHTLPGSHHQTQCEVIVLEPAGEGLEYDSKATQNIIKLYGQEMVRRSKFKLRAECGVSC